MQKTECYATGEKPQVGDVVRRKASLVSGYEYTDEKEHVVAGVHKFKNVLDLGEGYVWSTSNYDLVRRAAEVTTDPNELYVTGEKPEPGDVVRRVTNVSPNHEVRGGQEVTASRCDQYGLYFDYGGGVTAVAYDIC